MSAPTLTPAVIGRAENAHRPVLERILDGTGLDRQGWIALSLAAGTPAPLSSAQLRDRLGGALGGTEAEADEALAQAVGAQCLVRVPEDAISVTPVGSALRTRVLEQVETVVARAYGGVPADDLATAARVLAEITDRLATDPLLQQR